MTTIANLGSAQSGDWDEPERLDAASLSVLGQHRGTTYAATKDGRELRIGHAIAPYSAANPPDKDEVWVDRLVKAPHPTFSNKTVPAQETIRAYVVEPGTYAGLVAGDKALAERRQRATRRASTPRRFDLADSLPQLARAEAEALTLGVPQHAELTGPASRTARLVTIGDRPAVRGIEAIAAWIEARSGGRPAAVNGHLDLLTLRLDDDTLTVIDAFKPILVGHYAGQPVPCALRHGKPEPAWSLTAGGRMPVCREHLEQDR